MRTIRDAVGDEMDIAIELHGYWNLPSAVAIARALEPFAPMWLEEALPQDNLEAYARLKDETSLPLVLSERLMTRWQFREVLERGLAQFVNPDPCWCGGLTEARADRRAGRDRTTCRSRRTTAAARCCTRPVSIWPTAMPNLFILESVRRHYLQDYRGLVVAPYPARDGWLRPARSARARRRARSALLARPDSPSERCHREGCRTDAGRVTVILSFQF